MTSEAKNPTTLPIYKLHLNPQYPIIQDFINLFESTNLYIIAKKRKIPEDCNYIKDDQSNLVNDIISPLPSIIVFNFYREKSNDMLFFTIIVKNIILVIDFDQFNTEEVENFLIKIFYILEKVTFIPIFKEDKDLFEKKFPLVKPIFPLDLSDIYSKSKIYKSEISKFEEHIRCTFPNFSLQTSQKVNFYKPENIYLITYKPRLIYCINRYFYTNESAKLDFYHHRFSFNENYKSTDFFQVANLDSTSYFCINRSNFAPCFQRIFTNEESSSFMNFNNIVEFHKNVHFSTLLPCYGCIKEENILILVYKYMKNKGVKTKLNNQLDYLTPEIVSAILFRVSDAILFLHSNNFVHRFIVISKILFDSYDKVYLGGFELILRENADDEYTKSEFQKSDVSTKKENDILFFGQLIEKIDLKRPNCFKPEIKNLIKRCINENENERISARDLFIEICRNNFYYNGKDEKKLISLISNQVKSSNDLNINIRNTLKGIHISKTLTMINLRNSSNFEFNLMDIQIYKLKNRIFENMIVEIFSNANKKKLWRFAVFGFFKFDNGYFSTTYLSICVENKYFLINSYFLSDMSDFLNEMSKLTLIPISIESKNKFNEIIKEYKRKNEKESISFHFFKDREIQEISNAVSIINKISRVSLSEKEKINIEITKDPLIGFIQLLKNPKKYIQSIDFKLPLFGYFMQRIFFESESFSDSSFFNRFSKFEDFIRNNQIKNKFSLNDFQILKLIGSGGSAQVYLAIHNITLTFVALKIYDSKSCHFEREKNFFEHFGRQNYIIEYYGSCEEKKNVLILDFKSNGSISNFFNLKNKENFYYKPKSLSNNDLNTKIILRLIFALHHLHCNLKCIYQDLSLYNIMVDHNFDIFLSDFEYSIPFNRKLFGNDLIQFGKIIYYLCEKSDKKLNLTNTKISLFQLTNKNLSVLNLILRQCANDLFAKFGSTLLFIYEIKFFGFLYPSNKKEFVNKIIKENEELLKIDNLIQKNDLSFHDYVSNENKKMISFFYQNDKRIKFVSFLLGICFKNGFFVKKDYNKALDYFGYNDNENNNQNLDEIMSILSDKNSKITNFNRAQKIFNTVKEMYEKDDTKSELFSKINFHMGMIYMKGIGTKKDYSIANNYFDKSIQLIEKKLNRINNYDLLNNLYHRARLNEKNNQHESAFNLYSSLVSEFNRNSNLLNENEETNSKIFLISKIFYRFVLYSCLKSNQISPEIFNYFKKDKIFYGKIYEIFGDIFMANDDRKNSIRFYVYASKLGEFTSSFKLGLIYNEFHRLGLPSEDEFKNDFKSIYYLSKVLNFDNSELNEKEKKKLNEFKILSNILVLKYRIKNGLIDLNQIQKYKCFKIDLKNKIIEDSDDQIYLNLIESFLNKEILFCYNLATKLNNPKAQYILGILYYEGKYNLKDLNKAIFYFQLSSHQNYEKSHSILGVIYYEGEGIPHDLNKAIYYFQLAANKNNSESLFNLGLIYYEGEEIDQDLKKAVFYFEKAAVLDNPEAQLNLGLIYSEPKFGFLDINKAIHYLELASKHNLSTAFYNLGMIYYEKKFGINNIEKAIFYFEKASNLLYSKAHCILGMIYYEGKYVKKDILKSISYFQLASNQSFVDAIFNLAFIYNEGSFIEKDVDKALNYYQKAANLNDQFSKVNLAVIFCQIKKFEDAKKIFIDLIKQKNDTLAMYNLANVYFNQFNNIEDSFNLLLKAAYLGFDQAEIFLCFILSKKFLNKTFSLQMIKEIFMDNEIDNNELELRVFNILNSNQLENSSSEKKYYIYNIYRKPQDLTCC